jgi:hypothetical protein
VNSTGKIIILHIRIFTFLHSKQDKSVSTE